MGNSYYYFAASLPMLGVDSKPPMTMVNFLKDCQCLLSIQDFTLIEASLLKNNPLIESKNKVFNTLISFNRNLCNELVFFRAQRANKDPMDFYQGEQSGDPFLSNTIQEAAKLPNLLKAEKHINQAKWQFLDDLAVGHYFDIDYLIIYGQKLKILLKHQEYNSPKGKKIFEEIKLTEILDKMA